MHDVRLLLWLRARHARSALNRTLHLVGAGVDDGGWGERAYQLYAVGIMLVWAALMAAALVDAIQGVFVGLAAAVCSLAVQGALLAVALVLLRVGIAGARTTPLKLSHPDIAYLAASAVSARALAGVPAGADGARLRPHSFSWRLPFPGAASRWPRALMRCWLLRRSRFFPWADSSSSPSRRSPSPCLRRAWI